MSAREVLAEGLGQLALRGGYSLGLLASERLADDLLPVVQRLMDEHAAAELDAVARAALDATPGFEPVLVPVADLYARAAALRAATEEASC